jgi:NAD(P)-dependent dehydrogenase (short-subunit alcohol dehydrogenase family)
MARTALITGGSGGIGSTCVQSLTEEYDVAFQYYSNEAAAESLVKELDPQMDTDILSIQANVTDQADIESMVSTVRDEMGSIDILVNSAGVMKGQRLQELSPETIENVISINLVGTILCTREVLPVMANADIGHVVNVSSTAGSHGSHADPVYGASKGGLNALTLSLASIYTKENVFINAVAPGITETEILPDEWVENAEKGYPLGRLVQPEEVAEAVRFLVETTSISGEVVEIDQGKLL